MKAESLGEMGIDGASERIKWFLQLVLDASGMELEYAISEGAESDEARLEVVFEGRDAALLIARRGELLHALETLATELLGLAPEEHGLLSFNAQDFKESRAREISRVAEIGIAAVQASGRPYAFAPTNSRERRMLHLELAKSGLHTASSGEAARRFVVLYPAELSEEKRSAEGVDRARTIRNAFRPR